MDTLALFDSPIVGVSLKEGADLDGFRVALRGLIAQRISPDRVVWNPGIEADFLGERRSRDRGDVVSPVALPRAVGELIEDVVCHCDGERYALLYRLVWRVLHGERALMDVASDPLVHRLERMRKSVRRDLNKMHAFVRFRGVRDAQGGERFVAWFEPEHYIVEATANFFVERFRSMMWSILTPVGSLHWDRARLVISAAARRGDAPDGDSFEGAWKIYYENIFNPARSNPKAMVQRMAKKYWKNLPETASIPGLVRRAPARTREMMALRAAPAIHRNPDKAVAAMAWQEPRTLEELNAIIAASEPLTPGADRAVLGEGPIGAPIAFIGEQPGDEEERGGRPFIGPAGRLLHGALDKAGIDRSKAYLTNAVKHFKHELRGKKRLHKRPNPGEVKRYRWWLMKELSFVRPKYVVALGGTAALSLAGKPVSVTKERGPAVFVDPVAGEFAGYVTVHPSYLLRLPDERARAEAYASFLADLKRANGLAGG